MSKSPDILVTARDTLFKSGACTPTHMTHVMSCSSYSSLTQRVLIS